MSAKRQDIVNAYKTIVEVARKNNSALGVIKKTLDNIHIALINLQIEAAFIERKDINSKPISVIGNHIDKSCSELKELLNNNDEEIKIIISAIDTLKETLRITDEELK